MIELSVAGILISRAIMDSPIWEAVRLRSHHIPLWRSFNALEAPTSILSYRSSIIIILYEHTKFGTDIGSNQVYLMQH